RRVELAWGASIAAEWAHFVALGVFAYHAGGTTGVGIAGLVRMLPAAILAPLASSLGDRFHRERFMLAISLAGTVALAATALAYALLLALVHVEGRIEPAHTDFGVLEGARAVLHSPKPRLIVGLLAAQGFVRGCLNVLVVVLVFKELHTNGGAVGYLTAALGV